MKKARPDFKKYYSLYKQKYGKLFTDQDNRKMKGYIYLILTLFTVSFFGFFAIKPTFSTITTLEREKNDSQHVLDELGQKLSALQSLQNQYAQLESTGNLNLITSAVPNSPDIPSLSRKVEILAQENHVSLSRLDFGDVELYPAARQTSPIFSFLFNISIEGSTQDVNAFILSLIHFDRIVTLDRVTTNNTSNIQDAFITGRAYFYKQP